METIVEKRMPGMPDRLMDHIAAESNCTIVRPWLVLISIVFPNGEKSTAKNNTLLLIRVLKNY